MMTTTGMMMTTMMMDDDDADDDTKESRGAGSALVLEEGKVEREKREAQQLQLLLGPDPFRLPRSYSACPFLIPPVIFPTILTVRTNPSYHLSRLQHRSHSSAPCGDC
eukprot:3881426-Rhodomonas_salina.1